MASLKIYPSTITMSSNTNLDPYNGGHHKGWDYLNNLKTAGGTAYCRHESYESPYPLSFNDNPLYQSYMIATSEGTNHTPAPLEFTFDFSSIPSNLDVARIVVHYKQQTFTNGGNIIDLGGATCSMINGSTETNTGTKVSATLTEQFHTFYGVTKAQLQSSNFKIKLTYPKNESSTTPGQLIIKDFFVEVVTAQTLVKRPTNNRIQTGKSCGGDTNYKCWDNLADLANSNGTAYCRNPDSTNSPLIAGVNGTYNQPAPIDLTNFGFNFGSDIVIEKIEISYQQQTFINNGYYPEISNPRITVLNTSIATFTGQRPVTETLNVSKSYVHGVTRAQINSDAFGLRIAYPKNTATTPGRILLKNLYVKVYYNDAGTKLTLNGSFNPSSRTVGNGTSATFTVKKTSSEAYNSTTIIDLPLGIEVTGTLPSGVTKSNKTRNGYNYQQLTWIHNLPQGQNVANTITVNFNTTYPTKDLNVTDATTCTIKDQGTNISYKCYFTVYDIQVNLSSTLASDTKPLRAEYNNNSSVTVKSNDPQHRMKVLHIRLGDGDEALTNLEDIRAISGVDSAGFLTGAYWIKLTDNGSLNKTIPLQIWYDTGGEYPVHMWVSFESGTHVGNEIEDSFIVLNKEMGTLGFSRVEVNSNWTNQMGDGIYYTLGTLVKATTDNNNYVITDLGDNYRVGIYNSSPTYLNNRENFLERVVWCNNIATSTAKEVLVKFKYNKDYPLYIVYSHGYKGDPVTAYVTFNFTEHLLVETSLWGKVNNIGHSLWPIRALLIDHDTTYATATFIPSIDELIPACVYDWDTGGLLDSDISILGLEIMFDYISNDTVMVECELYVDAHTGGKREILVESGEGTAVVGSVYDLFGLRVGDLIDRNKKQIKPFDIRLKVYNVYSNRAKIQINNMYLAVEYVTRTKCGYGFSIDGERGEDYGILLKNVKHRRGTNNEDSLYHIEGTDTTVVNRINIDTKEIELEIEVQNCNIKNGRYQVDKVVELFTNDRYIHSNKPILKSIVFDHLDDREYHFVRIKEFDDKYLGGNYYATITLLVPEGTTYDVSDTLSGPNGYSPSSIAVTPTISYISKTAGRMVINENSMNQMLMINSSLIKNNSKITIDNSNRKVYLEDTIDITSYVDFNSTWFKLRGEYNFTTNTGKILEIAYKIRRG